MKSNSEHLSALPVAEYLEQILQTLSTSSTLVLRAAPGAGKTMLVPHAISMKSSQKVLLVEPRRVAAKGAASGMCIMHDMTLGRECGYAVRGESCQSKETMILAVTPGVFLSMLRSDPELSGFGCVVFDEFHERSAENDLALALLLDAREAFCPHIRVVIMSATIGLAGIKNFLQCPVLDIPGREFPVETEYMDDADTASDLNVLPRLCVRTVRRIYFESEGNILLFLPGSREITRTRELLEASPLEGAEILILHGSQSIAEQSRVFEFPADGRRRIILSTNIAESSLTVAGVRTVIDSGWERRMRYRPGDAMPFLEYCRISMASANQRSGRAGRTAPGRAVRLWSVHEERAFAEDIVPEILECELTPLVLAVAEWGADVRQLSFLDPPPEGAWQSAVALLKELALLDNDGRLTADGRRAAEFPVHPRLGKILVESERRGVARLGAELAAVLSERDDFQRYDSVDLSGRLLALRNKERRSSAGVRQSFEKLYALCRKDSDRNSDDISNAGKTAAWGFPDRIGMARARHSENYQLSGTRAAHLPGGDPLKASEFIVAPVIDGSGQAEGTIRLALPIAKEDIAEIFKDKITETAETFYDSVNDRGGAVKIRRFGNLVLNETAIAPDAGALAEAVFDEAVRRKIALPPPECKAAVRLVDRINFAARCGEKEFSQVDSSILRDAALPFISQVRNIASLLKAPWHDIVKSLLSYEKMQLLERLYPDFYRTPAGSEIAIDYSAEIPVLSVQIQQLYGEKRHPQVGSSRLPLKLELLSPARRPVQITGDLPGFWNGSWKLVRSEMRARYPKHEWPEDPANSAPMRNSIRKKF